MDTCGLERVERFRINLNEKNFASQKNTLTSSLPQRCRAVGTYGSGNDTLVNVSHVRAAGGYFGLAFFPKTSGKASFYLIGKRDQTGAMFDGKLVAPIRPKYRPEELADNAEPLLSVFRNHIVSQDKSSAEGTLSQLDLLLRGSDSIAERLERTIHPWACFLALPLFALASAGVSLSMEQLKMAISSPIALGIFLELVVGKAIGIFMFAFIAVRSKIAGMADGLTWSGIFGVAILAGVGFTVALFIGGLSFEEQTLVADSKVAVLAASLTAGSIGYIFLRLTVRDSSGNTQASLPQP